ncbi:Hypothetical protein AAM4_0002 [Actinomyces succiniciruminis]|uniref:Uncharacterized protein n=1 Tax=Actinomyces succiniciruminis TaxID=1522002 RepID=A0A1L7R7Y2_9ACTO|nr:Hypothetical protein AAM4_0002 [Actinomyces succiniciruminis]
MCKGIATVKDGVAAALKEVISLGKTLIERRGDILAYYPASPLPPAAPPKEHQQALGTPTQRSPGL